MGHLHGRLRRPRVWAGVGAVTQWFLPLFRTVAYLAPLRDHRGPAQVSALVAALPTLWPLADLWGRDFAPPISTLGHRVRRRGRRAGVGVGARAVRGPPP